MDRPTRLLIADDDDLLRRLFARAFRAEGFQVEVQTFYQQFLNRNADSDGLNHFVAAMLQGTRREPVIAGILGSDEYFSNF